LRSKSRRRGREDENRAEYNEQQVLREHDAIEYMNISSVQTRGDGDENFCHVDDLAIDRSANQRVRAIAANPERCGIC